MNEDKNVAFKVSGDWLPSFPIKEDSGDTLHIGNLECAFSNEKTSSHKAYSAILPHKCIENVVLSDYSALSVANNHSGDAHNFQSTLTELRTRAPQIQFFGTRDKPYAEFTAEGHTIAVIGCLEKCRSRMPELFPEESVLSLIPSLKKTFDTVYIYPHWGKESEYTRYPSPRQRKLARKWIDAGADGIFGSHSHVFQGREYYKSCPIYYSLGNFSFPHPESALYKGTDVGLVLRCGNGKISESFTDESDFHEQIQILNQISAESQKMTWWTWAKKIGAFYHHKNGASWRLRLKRNFLRQFPLFLVWQLLPLNLLMRLGALVSTEKQLND